MQNSEEQNIKNLFAELKGSRLSQIVKELIGGWLLSTDNEEAKNKELNNMFENIFDYNFKPGANAYRMLADIRKRLGVTTKKVTMPLRNRMAFKAAAVLTFIIGLSGITFLTVERMENMTTDNRTTVITMPAPTDDDMTKIAAENKSVTLPDNTTVSVENGEIRYAGNFNDSRSVELNGAARFNVAKAKDANDSFTIHTGHLDIKVLGTEFKVNSTAGALYSSVDLYYGSIEVKAGSETLVLKPTDRLHYDHTTRQTSVTSIPFHEITYDKMPELMFNKTPLNEVLQVVERNYHISFRIDGDILNDPTLVDGDLTSHTSLDEFMTTLQRLSGRFTYEITDNEIRVKINNI